jgi:hypothetical protein
MKIWMSGLIVVLILTSIAGVSALAPDTVLISTDHRWLEAGSGETSIITVQVINTTYPDEAVVGSSILVWCEDDQMGKITPSGEQKIKNGQTGITFTFKPGTKSGDAILHTRVSSKERTDPIEVTTIQRIDHSIPSNFASLVYPPEAPANSIVNISVRIKDSYGNVIDNRREVDQSLKAESFIFRDSDEGDGGFWIGDTYQNSVEVPVNDTGYSEISYKLSSQAGDNIISIQPPAKVLPSQTFISIKGTGGVVAHISAVLNPPSGVVYADNLDKVGILYTVTDSEGNRVGDVRIIRTTTLGESSTYTTNDEGQVSASCGPSTNIGIVKIIASVDGYPDISVENTVEFVHSDPTLWELTANPQTLASRDVTNITADLMVKVMDMLGNPVPNETVSFDILNTVSTVPLSPGGDPFLETSTALTDADGYAIVHFHSGAFPESGEPGFNETSTGFSTIRATWKSSHKEIVVTFRNYPYLRVETEVSPMTVAINDTVNVTVRLIGDGYALRAKPIDVVLTTDRSGSMLEDDPDDRMIPVMEASKEFVNQMDVSPSRDHVGLVSFGEKGWANLTPTSYQCNCHSVRQGGKWVTVCDTCWDWSSVYGSWYWVSLDGSNECQTGNSYSSSSAHQVYVNTHYPGNNRNYADYAIVEQSLSSSVGTIDTSISNMVPSGGTPMRYGIYKALKEITANSTRPSVVKAIIVLSDGDYNWYGDPLARGNPSNPSSPESQPYRSADQPNQQYWSFPDLSFAEQNLSVYAKNHNIKIYTIAYGEDISSYGSTTLQTLAESTGGKFYYGDATNIGDIYRIIAGELRIDAAAIDTHMVLDFESLNVTYDNLTTLMPGKDVFAYKYIEGSSTYISSWNNTMNPLPGHVPSYPYTTDQSADWEQNPPKMEFSIGNISINQTWQATFMLKVLTPGSISVFSPGSSVKFMDSEGNYTSRLPDMFVTGIENRTSESTNPTLEVAITGHSGIDPSDPPDLLHVYWNLNYSGNATVKQTLYYQFSEDNIIWSGTWIPVGTYISGVGPFIEQPFTGSIDVSGKTGWIKFRVTAKEQVVGGAYDEDFGQSTISLLSSRPYIIIT